MLEPFFPVIHIFNYTRVFFIPGERVVHPLESPSLTLCCLGLESGRGLHPVPHRLELQQLFFGRLDVLDQDCVSTGGQVFGRQLDE